MRREPFDSARIAWRSISSSVIGPGHLRRGLPNQDRCGIHDLGNGIQVYVVADGAGSCLRSDRGAQFAVDAAIDAARKLFRDRTPEGLHEWIQLEPLFRSECFTRFDQTVLTATHAVLEVESGQSFDDVRGSFATTLLAVIALPPLFLYLSVGDCFLVVQREPEGPHLMVTAAERENLGLATFLTSPDRADAAVGGLIVDDRIRGLALCSDGLAEGLLTTSYSSDDGLHYCAPPEFGQYFRHFARTVVDPTELDRTLASADFAETSSDDKTIVLAVALADGAHTGPTGVLQ